MSVVVREPPAIATRIASLKIWVPRGSEALKVILAFEGAIA